MLLGLNIYPAREPFCEELSTGPGVSSAPPLFGSVVRRQGSVELPSQSTLIAPYFDRSSISNPSRSRYGNDDRISNLLTSMGCRLEIYVYIHG